MSHSRIPLLLVGAWLAFAATLTAQDPCEPGEQTVIPPAGCTECSLFARTIASREDWQCMTPLASFVFFAVPASGEGTCAPAECLDFVVYRKNVGSSPGHLGILNEPDEVGCAVNTTIYGQYLRQDSLYTGYLTEQEDLHTADPDDRFIGVRINNSLVTRDDPETFGVDDARHVMGELAATLDQDTIGELRYVPVGTVAEERLLRWINAGDVDFAYHFQVAPPAPASVAYSAATNYGFVRVYDDLDDFRGDLEAGAVDSRFIPVLPRTPFDIEEVVAGVVTAQPAAIGNHVILRSVNRGTPFVFVDDALQVFRPFDDELIRLSVSADDSYEVRLLDKTDPDDLQEALDFWRIIQPDLSGTLGVAMEQTNLVYSALDSIKSTALMTNERGEADVSVYGGKGANLMRLVKGLRDVGLAHIVDDYIVDGFVIPFSYYEQGLDIGTVDSWTTDEPISPREYIAEIHALPEFQGPRTRGQMLARLRDSYDRDDYTVPMADEIEAIRERIVGMFGLETMVRFRSSSNAEDGLEFNGAGLYESTSVCAGDGDGDPETTCDPDKTERIQEGFEKVWHSLHGTRATSERLYSQLPDTAAKMAILVTPAFQNEFAGAVAFTGNPMDKNDKDYVVYVQAGETSVVRAGDGIFPETDILKIDATGNVTSIVRATRSTEVPECEFVLSDAQLQELGAVMFALDQHFPIHPGDRDPATIVKDIEFKFDASDPPRLQIKQIRPLLIQEPPALFVRGDLNEDGRVSLVDGIRILMWAFVGVSPELEPRCQDGMDLDDNGRIGVGDAIWVFSYAYAGGPPPRLPFPDAGIDPTPDGLADCTRP